MELISGSPHGERSSSVPPKSSSSRYVGEISRDVTPVLASTFSRRAPSGKLGANWEWNDTTHSWLVRPPNSKPASPSSVMQLDAPASPPAKTEASPVEVKPKPAVQAQAPMTEDELRTKLRPIFDKFDVDASGSISTDEMTNILKQLKIKMSPEQIGAMMKEADPDGSGSVDFEEFVTVLKRQMEAGGQLAAVVEEASSLFGFLNPFTWFKAKDPEPPKKEPPKKMTADELRTKLRPVFDKFDSDQSGCISTDEMTNILKQLKIKMTAAQIGAMMKEADPDGSGSVDFDEFCAVLTKQMESGGQLASVVDSASSFFGFLNPFSWFAPKPEEPAAKPEPASQTATPAVASMGEQGGQKQAPKPAATPAPATQKKAGEKFTEEELRAQLRPVFEKFDTDSSGRISVEEMKSVVAAINITLTPQQFQQMFFEADPDGSGAIDFEEFVTVLKKQMEAGGQMATIVDSAASVFGFLNPFSWFGQ